MLAGIAALMLDTWRLRFAVVGLALVVGLLVGVVAGWRANPPRAAVRGGAVSGAIAGMLLLVGALAGEVPISRITAAIAFASGVICLGLSVAVSGVIAAWTGYQPGYQQAATEEAPASANTHRPPDPQPTTA